MLGAALAAHLAAVNTTLDPHERLDCPIIVSEPWTVDNVFIAPTFKIRRNRIEEVCAAMFERGEGAHRPVVRYPV